MYKHKESFPGQAEKGLQLPYKYFCAQKSAVQIKTNRYGFPYYSVSTLYGAWKSRSFDRLCLHELKSVIQLFSDSIYAVIDFAVDFIDVIYQNHGFIGEYQLALIFVNTLDYSGMRHILSAVLFTVRLEVGHGYFRLFIGQRNGIVQLIIQCTYDAEGL